MARNNGLRNVDSFGTTLRKRIDASLALKVLHDACAGQDIKRTQLDAARILLGKCLPDLAAVAVDIQDTRPSSLADIEAKMLLAGVNPSDAWKLLDARPAVLEHRQDNDSEKLVPSLRSKDTPHTPETRDEA